MAHRCTLPIHKGKLRTVVTFKEILWIVATYNFQWKERQLGQLFSMILGWSLSCQKITKLKVQIKMFSYLILSIAKVSYIVDHELQNFLKHVM